MVHSKNLPTILRKSICSIHCPKMLNYLRICNVDIFNSCPAKSKTWNSTHVTGIIVVIVCTGTKSANYVVLTQNGSVVFPQTYQKVCKKLKYFCASSNFLNIFGVYLVKIIQKHGFREKWLEFRKKLSFLLLFQLIQTFTTDIATRMKLG